MVTSACVLRLTFTFGDVPCDCSFSELIVGTGLPAASTTSTRMPRPTPSPQRLTVRDTLVGGSLGSSSRTVSVPVTFRAGPTGRNVTPSTNVPPVATRTGGDDAPRPENAGLP